MEMTDRKAGGDGRTGRMQEQREAMEKREARGNQGPEMKCASRHHLVPGSIAHHRDPLTDSESE